MLVLYYFFHILSGLGCVNLQKCLIQLKDIRNYLEKSSLNVLQRPLCMMIAASCTASGSVSALTKQHYGNKLFH